VHGQVGQQDFESDPALNPNLAGAVNGAHATHRYQGLNAVLVIDHAPGQAVQIL
jgi:hypothetical protein